MQTFKQLVDKVNALEPCEGFISLDFEDVTTNPRRTIHLRAEDFKKYFAAYTTEKFDREQNKISVTIGKVTIFALDDKETNV